MDNFFSQDMLAFLVSRYEYPNKAYDIAGFVCGEKYKGFKRLKAPERNEYTPICEILFHAVEKNQKNYHNLSIPDQYSINVASRLALLMGMAALYNGEHGHWKQFKDTLIEKGVESVSANNLITWVSENTRNTTENGEIYGFIFDAGGWGIMHMLERQTENLKSSLIKKMKP